MAWDENELQPITATFSPAASQGPPTKPVTITLRERNASAAVVDGETMTEVTETEFRYDWQAAASGKYFGKVESADHAIAQFVLTIKPDDTN